MFETHKIGLYFGTIARTVWKVREECEKLEKECVKVCNILKPGILFQGPLHVYLKLQKQTNIGCGMNILSKLGSQKKVTDIHT